MINPYRNDTDRDFHVEDSYTLILLRPMTPSAREWIGEHISADAMKFGDAVVVEHRFVGDLLIGIQDDGLTFAVL